VTPIRASAGRAARGETIKLRVPAALLPRGDAIWRLGLALQALIDSPAKRLLRFVDAVAALPGGRFEGEKYRARCPAHDGEHRNLSVWADENGIACFKCWSHGCSTKEIVAALGAAPTWAKFAPRRAEGEAGERG
jgi:hypothetical protein